MIFRIYIGFEKFSKGQITKILFLFDKVYGGESIQPILDYEKLSGLQKFNVFGTEFICEDLQILEITYEGPYQKIKVKGKGDENSLGLILLTERRVLEEGGRLDCIVTRYSKDRHVLSTIILNGTHYDTSRF